MIPIEEIRCACGAVMTKIGSQTAALNESAAADPKAEKVTVDIYECDDCGSISFYRVNE